MKAYRYALQAAVSGSMRHLPKSETGKQNIPPQETEQDVRKKEEDFSVAPLKHGELIIRGSTVAGVDCPPLHQEEK